MPNTAPTSIETRIHHGAPIRSMAYAIGAGMLDRKSTRLNSSHSQISYAVFCLKKKKTPIEGDPHQLRQVILNLSLNAEQGRRDGQDRGTLRLRSDKRHNSASAVFAARG